MNLADPELELIDPTPNIHNLFILFDKQFFWTKLASRAVVRWSKRMYSCAGICSYEGRGGLCDIALSEPLLKLRPRKDLVETLLHEMIHAFLFVTSRDQDRDGHGPNFQAHMHRINKTAGLNISIYHDFHDEVKLYQTHWWRCNGPCQTRKPYFGIVRRSRNQVPGPNDFWWAAHQKGCGGTFVKIKEPIKQPKKAAKSKANNNADITKYITNNNNKTSNKNVANKNPDIGVLKDCSNVPLTSNAATKSNSSSTVVVTKKGNVVFNPRVTKPTSAPIPFSGNGQSIRGDKEMRKSLDVIDTVRNVWANKQLSSSAVNTKKNNPPSRLSTPVASKQKNKFPSSSPPIKIQKIDNYFKTTASSILKDVYGEDFNITESDDNKLKAVNAKNFVDCPICSRKIDSDEINKHLDECLNTQVLEQLSQSNNQLVDIEPVSTGTNMTSTDAVKKKNGLINPSIDKDTKPYPITDCIDLTFVSTQLTTPKIEPGSSRIHSSNEIKPKVHRNITNIKSEGITDLKPDNIKLEPSFNKTENIIDVKVEPTSVLKADLKACPCCGKKFDKPVEEHLEECLGIFNNDCTIPEEGASTSYTSDTIDIDDDEDMFDETLTLNATGTKCPCPCCLQMVEAEAMNEHLDDCLR